MNNRATALSELLPFARALVELEPDLKRLDRIDAEEAEAKAKIDALGKTEETLARRVEERRATIKADVEAAQAQIARLNDEASTILSKARATAEGIKVVARDAARKTADDATNTIAATRQQFADEKRKQAEELAAARTETQEATRALDAINNEIKKRQSVLDEAKQKLAALGD